MIGQLNASADTFLRASEMNCRTILDYTIARHDFARELLTEEQDRRPLFADSTISPLMEGTASSRARIRQEQQLADLIVVGSKFAASTFEGTIPSERVKVVNYGVNCGRFRPRQDYRRGEQLRVLFVGHLSQRKGIADLLESITLLDPSRFSLTIVGQVIGSGRGLRQFEDKFCHIQNTRPQDMPAIYEQCDVLVLPSLVEGSALVVLEAMATGIPVIVTPNAGADALEDNIHGYVVPIRSPESIAARLMILEQDPDKWERMGRSAARRARENDWSRFHAEFRNVLGYDTKSV